MFNRPAPKCPWCGDEMIQGGVNTVHHVAWYHCQNCKAISPAIQRDTMKEAVDDAYAAAVKRVEEPNRVLAIEEIYACETPCPFWVEWNDPQGSISVEILLDTDSTYAVHFKGNGAWTDMYNRSWRCWLRKPTSEERAAVPWKDVVDGGVERVGASPD